MNFNTVARFNRAGSFNNYIDTYYQIDYRSGNVDFYYDGTKWTHTTNVPSTSISLMFRDKGYVDWALVRKYISPEPVAALTWVG